MKSVTAFRTCSSELARSKRGFWDAGALWAVASHQFGRFPIFPRLFVSAAEKQSGKTTLLDVIGQLVTRPLMASNVTPSSLFRSINITKPVLLLDEADTYAKESEEIRGIINAGHRADGAVIRNVGDNFEPRTFDVFSPVVLAAIGDLATTIIDRSIIIKLRRRRPDEPIEALRLDRPPAELKILARKAARWAADHSKALGDADPAMPTAIWNRAADNWRPLLAVADLAGGEWPARARVTAVALAQASAADSTRIQLLADIREAFVANGREQLSSAEIIKHLTALEGRPWPEFGRARKPISPTQIARLLAPLHISPGTIWLAAGSTPKGYQKSAFEDAWARYLPSLPSSSRDTPF